MDQYYAKDTHEPIVEKTIFYAVQSLLKNRQATFKQEKRKNRYPLTSCIRCSECGSFYHRKVRSGVIKWVCSKHAADTNACNSGYYSEERIYDGIITMINKLRFCEEDILGQTIQKLEFAASVRSFRTFRFLQPEDRTMKRSWRPSTPVQTRSPTLRPAMENFLLRSCKNTAENYKYSV